MNAREAILGRIREALTQRAPFPGIDHEPPPGKPLPTHSPAQAREWLPVVGKTFEDRLAKMPPAIQSLVPSLAQANQARSQTRAERERLLQALARRRSR